MAIGDQKYELVFFGDRNVAGSLDAGGPLADLPCEQTTFVPVSADGILLFSDGQFSRPAAGASPAVYPFLNPGLNGETDAAITDMEIRGKDVVVTVSNDGRPRKLFVEGRTFPVTESQTFVVPLAEPGSITANLSPGDAWPENDWMTILPNPPMHSQRWWIGDGDPAGDWRGISTGDLANFDAAEFLAPSVIVLNDVSAADLPALAADHLENYVRDLGGTLVILGGPHAFAAGDYDGSVLGAMSPLASSPPRPAMRWMLLADSSGSMANDNLWPRAAGAIVSVVPRLPPRDPVFIGQFAESLRWWSAGKSAAETALLDLPPSDALPHGPTNLEAVLNAIVRDASGSMESQLLLVTDADVTFEHPDAVTAGLKARKIHLHLLAIAPGRGLGVLSEMAAATGGSVSTQLEPARWAATIQELLASALPARWNMTPRAVHFIGRAASLGTIIATRWNRTWLAPNAAPLNRGDIPMAAARQFGLGEVVAAAFYAPELGPIFAQPPRDPRFKISWSDEEQVGVCVDAENGGKYLNDLPLRLELSGQAYSIRQVGPGRYQVDLPAPRIATMARVTLDGRMLDIHALPGRYAAEFDRIGLDVAALRSLAEETGGKVIPPNVATPVLIGGPSRRYELMPWLAAFGAVFIAMGLVMWKRQD